MNGFVGSTFYDAINKFLIGLLLWLPLCDIWHISVDKVQLMLLSVLFWITGVIYWGIITFGIYPFFSKCNFLSNCKYISWIMSRNNIKWINKAYERVQKDIFRDSDSEKQTQSVCKIDELCYLENYLFVQNKGLLGNIPILESLSAFFQNLALLPFFWLIGFLIKIITLVGCKCPIKVNFTICSCIVISGLIILMIICGRFRKLTEEKIFYMVLQTSYLSKKFIK